MLRTRREERREETIADIKRLAWEQIEARGAAGLSLREISRQMRMSSAALFRYFPNRDALLTALSRDAFAESYACMAAARDAAPEADDKERILAAGLAYRNWALHSPNKFALIYGAPAPDYTPDWPALLDEARKGLELYIDLVAPRMTGRRLPACDFPGPLRAQFEAILARRQYAVTPEALYFALIGWTRLHGLVALEVFGHIQPLLADCAELYRYEILQLLRQISGEEEAK